MLEKERSSTESKLTFTLPSELDLYLVVRCSTHAISKHTSLVLVSNLKHWHSVYLINHRRLKKKNDEGRQGHMIDHFYKSLIFNRWPLKKIFKDFLQILCKHFSHLKSRDISRDFLRSKPYQTYIVAQIYRFHCWYPVQTLVPRYIENQLIPAVNIKSSYGITIHVIIENETSCCSISRNRHLKFCVVTLSPRRRSLYIHVVSWKSIKIIILILWKVWTQESLQM